MFKGVSASLRNAGPYFCHPLEVADESLMDNESVASVFCYQQRNRSAALCSTYGYVWKHNISENIQAVANR